MFGCVVCLIAAKKNVYALLACELMTFFSYQIIINKQQHTKKVDKRESTTLFIPTRCIPDCDPHHDIM